MTWIVAGPPCSGKTTWARANALPGQTILDWDDVYAEVTGLPLYVHGHDNDRRVDTEFKRRLSMGADFIIRMAPTKQHRAVLRRIHHAESIVLAVPADVCMARLEASDRPALVKDEQAVAIQRWWLAYQPSEKDVVST